MIEKRCGKVAYELKLSDAVARGILKLPIYITSRYIFEEDIKNIEARLEQIEDEKVRQELEKKLRKAKKQLENAEGLKDILSKHLEKDGKYLVFCNLGDDLEVIIEKAKEEGWFDEINESQTFLMVESSRKDAENAIALRVFERSKGKDLRILFSKNMLNEGIHDEEITGEIMMRLTKSYILFIQQLGRILSKDRGDSPIVLDLVGNIHYFKEFRLEIQRIIREAEARGDKRYDARVLEQFRIIEEQEDFIKAFEEIENSIAEYLNRTSISKTLEVARILNANGVDLRKIQLSKVQDGRQIPILLREIEQEGIDIGKIIEENGLDGKFEYGKKIITLRSAYNGRGGCKITEQEKEEARQLGIMPEETKSIVAQTLEIVRILKANGVDISKVQLQRKSVLILLEEIEQEGIDIGKIIEENGLDGKFGYGKKIAALRLAYNGKGSCKITEQEKAEARQLGIIPEKSIVAQTLEIVRILKANGVDLSKVQLKRKSVLILLEEIEQEGIDIGKIIEENGLDGKFGYGKKIAALRLAYNGKGSCKITEQEKAEARQLGIIPEKSIVAQTLEIVRILKANGVDLSKVQLKRKSVLILLEEIEQEGIDIGKIIEENGLDGKFEYGKRISVLRGAYNGKGGYKITEQEKAEARQLGIIRVLKGQDIGKASFDASVEKCDEAQVVLDSFMERARGRNWRK